jgi:hypothetical protein
MCRETSVGCFNLIIDESHTDIMENARKNNVKKGGGGGTLWK